MLKMNRTTEYGLIALRHISRKSNGQTNPEVTSAREIADLYGLPFEITAKTLQRLKDNGLIQSAHGSRGGYTLQRSLETITLKEYMEFMEGAAGVVPCSSQGAGPVDHQSCEYHGRCEIRGVMKDLSSKFQTFLASIRLAELG